MKRITALQCAIPIGILAGFCLLGWPSRTGAGSPAEPAASAPPAAGSGSAKPVIHWRNGLQVKEKNLLGHHDVVYLRPARYEHEAMPVGNGRLCAMVWNEHGLDLQLNHEDNVWFQSSSGRMRLTADTDLFAGATEFEQRQSLYGGTVRTRCRGPAGDWTATTTVFEGTDVVAIHFEGNVRGKFRLELEQWRPAAKRLVDGIGFVEDLPVPPAPQFARRQALLATADCGLSAGTTVTRNGRTIIPVALQPAATAAGRVSFTVYIANVFTLMEEPTTSSPRIDPRNPPPTPPGEGSPAPRFPSWEGPVVGQRGSFGSCDPAAKAAAALALARQTGWKKNATRTGAAWAKFWEKSFVSLTSPDGVADYMANLWFLQLYWLNCGGRGEFPVRFNGGPFIVHRDTRFWGSCYWYQNTREVYWPLPAANHLELCAPLHHLYRSVLPVEMEMTRRLFKVDGAQYQETMQIDGSGDKEANPYTCLYLTSGIEMSYQFYRHYLYSRDEDFLKSTVWPIVRETVRFYANWVKKENDGLYHIYPTNGKETWWRVKDAVGDLAALRRIFPIFIELNHRFGGEDNLAGRCADVLKHLAPYPTDPVRGVWLPCIFLKDPPPTGNPVLEKLYPPPNTSHSLQENHNQENVECEPIFPWDLVGLGSDTNELALAQRTFRARRFLRPPLDWEPASVLAARLGSAAEAVENSVGHLQTSQHWPQGFWGSAPIFWASYMEDYPNLEVGINALTTSEMLLQSWNGAIRVWPAVPETWNGAFRLRAQTGFMVVSERSAGTVAYVAVESLFGDDCRLVSPWPDEWVVTRGRRPIARGSQTEIVFPTTKGQTYLIERAAVRIATMAFAPLAPPVNADVKCLHLPGDELPQPRPGQPMLGITRAGLTPVRVKIQLNRDAAAKAIRAIVGDRQPLALQQSRLAAGHAAAKWIDSAGTSRPAPWVIDGHFGTDLIPPEFTPAPGQAAGDYVLELSEPAPVVAVVWSYDRTGVQCDASLWTRGLKTVVVETSADGVAWTPAGQAAWNGSVYGQAIPLAKPVTAKFLRLGFRDPAGQPTPMTVDEIEVY